MADSTDSPPADPLAEALTSYYSSNGFSLCGVDLFCLGPISASNALTLLLTMVGGATHPETGQSPFSHVCIAYPKAALSTDAASTLLTRIVTQVERNKTNLPAGVEPAGWVSFERVDLRLEALVELADGLPEHSALIVLRAADFRVEQISTLDLASAKVPEDVWVPQLHNLARLLLEVSTRRSLPVILEAGRYLPSTEALSDLLKSLDGVGLMGAEPEAADAYIARNIARWDELLALGSIGDVLSEIEGATELPPRAREVYRLQILYRAGLYGQTIEAIENITYLAELDAPLQLRLARIASDCGALVLASRLLNLTLPSLATVEDLLAATLVAANIDDRRASDIAEARLAELYPGHSVLADRHRMRLRAEGRFQELAEDISASDPQNSRFYRALADALTEMTSYRDAATKMETDYGDRAGDIRFLLARHAIAAASFCEAADLLLHAALKEQRHISLLIETMEALILRQQNEADKDLILSGLQMAVTFLSDHPDQADLRVRLEGLFSFEKTGHAGKVYLALVTLSLLSRPLDLLKDGPLDTGFDDSFSIQEIRPVVEWLNKRGTVLIGQTTIPREIILSDPDRLASNLMHVIDRTAAKASDGDDVNTLNLMLSVVSSINAHTQRQNYDLTAMRFAAAGYISAGRSQQARDLAEQALRVSSGAGQRRRQGWFAFADIYLRLGSNIESLVGFACAAAGETNVDGQAAWSEMNGVARIFRELGLFDLARQAHQGANVVLRRLGLEKANSHRTRLIGLSIDFSELASDRSPSHYEVTALLERAVECAREAIDDHPDPPLLQLAQIISMANANGIAVGESANEAFKALLPLASRRGAILAHGFSSSRADKEALLTLYAMQEPARYAEDAGFDARNVALLAKRMLWNEGDELDATTATFLTELLADRGMPLPGWEATSRPVPSLSDSDQPASIAAAVSAECAVVALGLDSNGRLARTTWVNGEGSYVRELPEVFSSEAFETWKKTLPFEYGVDDGATANFFYTTTEHLRVTGLPDGPVIVVADSDLQIFPANLLRVGDTFAGQVRPISAVPSLSWLNASRESPASSNGRMMAWISSRTEGGFTLAMVSDRLAETFATYGVELDESDQLPEDFTGAELAIVTAHGSLGDSSQFQRVRDEGDLVVSASDVASKLRNVRVAVLFVCSAGRADKVPGAATTFGLAKKVLEKGSSAVIASPWPLDSRVTYHWLPTFLDAWTGGQRLDEALFKANQAVGEGLGYAPETALALSLYGDPGLIFKGAV
jgi:tetratricopeptide (TPR) repeat protein